MAEDVLRLAGFVEHVNYEKQIAVEGGRSIPDFTFMLPKGHVLYMDVKFPLTAYLRYLQATTDDERSRERQQFLRDVRLKVKELAAARLPRPGADLVRPAPPVHPERERQRVHPRERPYAHRRRPRATRSSSARRSPCSRCSASSARRSTRSCSSRRPTRCCASSARSRTQFDKYTEAVDKLGKRLESVQAAYDELNGTRRRALEKPARQDRRAAPRARPRRPRPTSPPAPTSTTFTKSSARSAPALVDVSAGGDARGPAVARASA